MRFTIGFIAILALAACESNGQPSKGIGAALDGFQRGFGNGPQPVRPVNTTPMRAPPVTMQPLSQQAVFTGKGQQVQTVTGQMAWQCQYNYAGQSFYLLMQTYCPFSVPVQ
jgi:hypothetical protein